MSSRSVLVPALLAAVSAAVWFGWPSSKSVGAMPRADGTEIEEIAPASEQRGEAAALAGDADQPATTEPVPGLPQRELSPGESVPITIPSGLTDGLRCPDGSYLPLLNDVPYAGPIERPRQSGPLPPVVALERVDGLDWYVHADGSRTTTHWATIEVEGEPQQNVLTRHLSAFDPGLEVGR